MTNTRYRTLPHQFAIASRGEFARIVRNVGALP
jgi:hypothetical protein